jgi:predicted RNA binding protein YcfA (HicA-like mRNA interferase family)
MAKAFLSREIIKRLEADGWEEARQTGSHKQFTHPRRPGRVTVAHPVKTMATGTVRSIFRQAGWSWPPR